MPGLHYRFQPTPIDSSVLAGADEGPDVHRLFNRQGAVTPGWTGFGTMQPSRRHGLSAVAISMGA